MAVHLLLVNQICKDGLKGSIFSSVKHKLYCSSVDERSTTWDDLALSADLQQRLSYVNEANKQRCWKARGHSMVWRSCRWLWERCQTGSARGKRRKQGDVWGGKNPPFLSGRVWTYPEHLLPAAPGRCLPDVPLFGPSSHSSFTAPGSGACVHQAGYPTARVTEQSPSLSYAPKAAQVFHHMSKVKLPLSPDA